MKTVVIISSVLAIVAMVHSVNFVKKHQYYTNLLECKKEFNTPEINEKIALCTILKDRELVNEHKEIVLENALERLEDLISDPQALRSAKDTTKKCYFHALALEYVDLKLTQEVANCAWQVLHLFDPLL